MCCSEPLTFNFSVKGKVTLYFSEQNREICFSFPGSWLPNWLQGTPITTILS